MLPSRREPVRGSTWQGEKVRLRAIEPGDWERFHAFDQDTETQRSGYRIPFPRSEEATRRWAEDAATAKHDDDNVHLAIEAEGALVGSINVHGADTRNGTFEYGITIGREYRGRGYAADAIRIVLRYYFNELRYQKANATAYAFNEPSQRLHRKLGFVEEGRIRRNYYTNGAFHDEIWYGITAEEFRSLDTSGPVGE